MGYTPENNPYIPGDPYGYDLAWMVEEVKKAQGIEAASDENRKQAEAWAVGEIDGVPVTSDDPQYHRNARYYADDAFVSAEQAEAWAVGTIQGIPITSDAPQYENNSKYYADQAASDAQTISDQLTDIPDMKNDISVLEGRVDSFASLPPGSTAGNAELLDIRIAANGDTYPSAGDAVRGQIEDVQDILDAICEADTYQQTTDTPQTVVKNAGYYYWNSNATANSTYFYVHINNLEPGDIITQTAQGGYAQPSRFIDAYLDSTRVAASCVNANTYSYTVPNGVNNVYITCYATYMNQITFYVKRTVTITDIMLKGSAMRQVPKEYKFNSASTDQYYLSDYKNSLKKNVSINYFAKFSSFTKVNIGISETTNFSLSYLDYLEIDNTTVNLLRVGAQGISWTHGLTITDYISVQITYSFGGAFTAKICTNGGEFTFGNYFYLTSSSHPFAVLVAASPEDVKLSLTCADFQKRIVIFGDSYLSGGSSRWLYYLPAGALNNLCLNGYPGQDSPSAIIDCSTIFNLGSPKYAVWCLGMNDGSDTDDSTPSSQWLTNVQIFIDECERRNIIPVLAAIPSVPSINNRAKSAWVRASGYRFIDFASAVNSDNAGNWYSGMLASDNIHPDVEGARALCARALTDFPEMLIP